VQSNLRKNDDLLGGGVVKSPDRPSGWSAWSWPPGGGRRGERRAAVAGGEDAYSDTG